MPPLVCSQFPAAFLKQLQIFRELRFLCDVRLIADGRIEFPAHRLVLAASSPFFQELFQAKKDAQDVTTVHLRNCNPECVLVVLQFLYSGELHLHDCDPGKVLNVARACKIAPLEIMLASYGTNNTVNTVTIKQEPKSNANSDSRKNHDAPRVELAHPEKRKSRQEDTNGKAPPEFLRKFCQIHSLLGCNCNCPEDQLTVDPGALQFFLTNASSFVNGDSFAGANFGPSLPKIARNSLMSYDNNLGHRNGLTLPTMSNQDATTKNDQKNGTTVVPTNGTVEVEEPVSPTKEYDLENGGILPVDDRDGWCRNKKYIKKTPTGFQCTICKKTYGRYNSVSYHVTIYHRNPPIQCDQSGCTFSTREARYIHFHKYYRHDIALPTNIDLESRRCPFCKHVAKSPAMLEKHINRHMPGSIRVGRTYHCELCKKDLGTRHSLMQHMLTHKDDKSLVCDKCSYKGSTADSLQQHKIFKHSGDLWCNKFQCEVCHYSSPSEAKLLAHKKQVHKVAVPDDKLPAEDLASSDHSDFGVDSGAEEEPCDSPPSSYSMVTVLPASCKPISSPSSCSDDIAGRHSVINSTKVSRTLAS